MTRPGGEPATTVDVVYVNYNSTALLLASVESLLAAPAAGFALGAVIVVDNASAPAHAALLDRLPARVQVIRSPANKGFAAGCNLGARLGDAEAIFFLNPDTHVLADTLPPLARALRQHAGRALAGARQFMDAECTLSLAPVHGASLFGDVVNTLWSRGFAPDLSRRYLRQRADLWRSPTPRLVRSLSGGALLVGRAAFTDLGGFDESFFLYVEDTDLCVRARARGLPVLYVPAARVVHYGDQSSKQNEGAAAAAAAAGVELYLRKHHGALARRCRRLLLAGAARLPQRQRRWRTATPVPPDFEFSVAGTRPWVVELGRSPLFDNGLTAFPAGPSYRVPAGLWQRLRPGTYYARTAQEVRAHRWTERGLYSVRIDAGSGPAGA